VITRELLHQVYPMCQPYRLEHFVAPLAAACEAAEINTRPRVAAFLAQAGHESRQLMALEENLNYSAEGLVGTFGSIFAGVAAQYARQPEKIANRAYASKGGNGDEASGDGWMYRGRGLFQVTLKDNYRACSIAICGDADTLLINPELLADPDYACQSAAWYWSANDLNRWADIGDFETLTGKINRAKHGLAQRVALWKAVLGALALT
jgi:putative chitinase